MDLEVNPVLFSKRIASEKSISNNTEYFEIDTIGLPFIDDFSTDKFKHYYNWNYPAPTESVAIRFTVNGVYQDSLSYAVDDTTWNYYYTLDSLHVNLNADLDSAILDSAVMLAPYEVIFYNGYNPFLPNDTAYYWPVTNIYHLTDSAGGIIPDTTVIVNYYTIYNSHDTIFTYLPDFSANSLWIDNYAFLNSTYPIYPPSIGVATLDGVDDTGMPYEFTINLPHGVADHLTSKPINIELGVYEPGDSLYLSFFYQPQGIGNSPELNDSLILQFRTPTYDWKNIWYAEGSELPADSMFKQVMIPIDSSIWFRKGFQFRFLNYATLSGNVDHWHIDYIMMKDGRTIADTILNDVAVLTPTTSVLKKYQSMPWSHYKADTLAAMGDSSIFYLKNHSAGPVYTDFEKYILDSQGNTLYHPNVEAADLEPFRLCYNEGFSCNSTGVIHSDLGATFFPVDIQDSAEFEILNFISPQDNNSILTNDTISYKQIFHNYYAYDDGTAENGYGLEITTPTGVAMAAYKFFMIKQDTLRGVRFYFNPQLEDVSQKLFSLVVWTGNETPETLVYQKDSLSPEYSPGLNYYRTYTINDTALLLPAGNFFVGWMQQSNYRINVGFDRNLNANENMYYNILGGGWLQSVLPGSWMLRPVFSEDTLPPDVFSIEENSLTDFSIFPNPASDEVYITPLSDTGNNNDYNVTIFNSLGSVVKQVSYLPRSVSVSDVATGFYFISIQNKETQEQKTYKLIISR